MSVRLTVITLIVASAALAGCLAAPAAVETTTRPATSAALDAPRVLDFAVNATKCDFAGGAGLVPFAVDGPDIGQPSAFVLGDTDVFVGIAATDPPTEEGNLHSAFECEQWMVNGHHEHMPTGGIIGLYVAPPAFKGLAPVARNFLVSTVASHDDAFVKAIHDAGFYVYPGVGRIDDGLEGGDLSIALGDHQSTWDVTSAVETAGDGIYQSHLMLSNVGATWPVVRFWFIVDGSDMKLHPIALDIAQKGGTGTFMGNGVFSHLFTSKHPGDAVASNIAGLGFYGVDWTMTMTGLPDEVSGMWNH
ncbi:MAG: hypothetical protein ACYDCK_10140 [Thermoplasmatota archaeon]